VRSGAIAWRSGALVLAALTAALLAGCKLAHWQLRIYPPAYHQVDVEQINAILQQDLSTSLLLVQPLQALSPLEALTTDQADLTIVENSTPYVPGVRTVLPLYRSVMHLLVRDGLDLAIERQATRPITIYVLNDSNAGKTFVELASQRSDLLAENYQLVSEFRPGETDMFIYFGPVDPRYPGWYQRGYRLFSLDEVNHPGREFFEEGISYLVPQLQSIEIPALTYDLPGNERALKTLAVDTLLVARADTPEMAIYRLTRTILKEKPRFAAIAPNVFSWLTENFDREQLSFPLHDGARRYIERDEPGFLQRYAETINLLVYLGILLASGLFALFRWRVQRKKDRIDTFYTRVLAIRERAATEPPGQLREELLALEKEAFALLLAEKLAADESFRIFTDLLARARAEL